MKRKILNFKVGADVEVFLKKGNEIISAEGIIPGTKDNPFRWDPNNKFYGLSLDNVLAEFNIPPATNKEEFFEFLTTGVQYINTILPDGVNTEICQAASLDKKYLQTKNALLFGCEPDFNAYTLAANERPSAKDTSLRSAGGHVHIGYDDPDEETNVNIVKALDLYVGVPSVIQEPDNKRKELYGKAGAFRNKPYGVEYRTLSNYYLASKNLILWLYDAVKDAIHHLNTNNSIDKALSEFVQACINTSDKDAAEQLIKHFNLKTI